MGKSACWLVALIAAVGTLGCSSEGPAPKPVTAGKFSNVGRIVVSVSGDVAADREARFQKVDGSTRLATALEAELTKAGRFDRASPRVMNVLVTKYRLRSGASVFMWGMMSGGDVMDVTVTVRENERELVSCSTGAGSAAGGGLDQISRFEHLAKAVAKRVVKEL